MLEYKVMTVPKDEAQADINGMARRGWRLVGVQFYSETLKAATRTELDGRQTTEYARGDGRFAEMVFEREADVPAAQPPRKKS